MEKRPDALLLKFAGTNCDEETARALRAVGFEAEIMPFPLVTQERIEQADLVVLAGGFSYGDYIMAGKLAQLELQQKLGSPLKTFHEHGGFLLGICNGFQILMRLGLLPEGSLIHNVNGRFICRWVGLEQASTDSPYLAQLPATFELPIAHAEGRFVAPEGQSATYREQGHVALTYVEDVNGSEERIAGIQDASRRVFGLMPHPERFLYREHHCDPDWAGDAEWGWGYFFFKSIHDAIVLKRETTKQEASA
jgi:phosphoribosylformylglycinamidine synthase